MVDAYVEQLDLRDFDNAQPADTGRPGYHPSTLLKIYLYGYLNRIQSSRRLECEARRNVGVDQIHVLADRGYFSGKEILACESVGAIPYVPKPYTSESKAAGRFAKDDFVFNPSDNTRRCPAGEDLTYRFSSIEHDLTPHSYWTTKCLECPIKARCTTEGVVDAMLHRLENAPDSMNVRRRTDEHPFGTLKSWMGATHFLTKGLDNVATEMSLNVLAYNLKRMMAIIGVKPLIERLAA